MRERIVACERSDYAVTGVARMLPILMATVATRSRRAGSGAEPRSAKDPCGWFFAQHSL